MENLFNKLLPGLIVGFIFFGSAAVAWWYKRDDLNHGDWCTIVGFWFFVALLLELMGFGN